MDRAKLEIFFKPVEMAVLATYLGRRDLLPEQAAAIEAREVHDPEDWNEERDGIAPLRGAASYNGRIYSLENAVARICLSGVQDSLPRWRTGSGTGSAVLTRTIQRSNPIVSGFVGVTNPRKC